jgi:hypothetical protein
MRRALLVATIVSAAHSAWARPGSPERYPVGANVVGRGGADIAAGTQVWHNPAGLGHVSEVGLSASVSAYGYTVEEAPSYAQADLGYGTINGRLITTALDIFPASIGYVRPLGEHFGMEHGIGISFVVPDFDQFDGQARIVGIGVPFEFRVRRRLEAETFWLVAAWGACTGDLVCLGVGPAAAVHMEEELDIQTLFAELEDGSTLSLSQSVESDTIVAAGGAVLGAQLRVREGLWLGLTARSPMRSFYGYGSSLHVQSRAGTGALAGGWVDRVEVTRPRLAYKLPWRFGAGLAWDASPTVRVAIDARVTTPQPEYERIAGPNGETHLPPSTPTQVIVDPTRAIRVGRSTGLAPSWNVNAGAEAQLAGGWLFQAGMFTDLSATPVEKVAVWGDDRLSRIGATIGGGMVGEQATTWVAVMYAYGWGKTVGFDTEQFIPKPRNLRSQSLTLLLGSSVGR